MRRLNKFRKKERYGTGKWPERKDYYYDLEESGTINDLSLCRGRTYYGAAELYEWERIFEGTFTLSPEKQLEVLQKEIKIRVRITKNEIFKIGELLIYAKNICQQEGKKFQEWIGENLDFSYETANNFMNVYKHCLGIHNIAMKLSPSILYQISAPSFPEELRKHLFDTEQINEITNDKLKELTRKYKEGGFEAIKDDIEELNSGHLIYRQSHYTLDMVENALRTLEDLNEKIEGRGEKNFRLMTFENKIKGFEPEAFEINSKLHNALHSAIELLETAQHESKEILSNMRKRLHDKFGGVESDGRNEKKGKVKIIKLKKVWNGTEGREKREKAEFDAKFGKK